LVGEEDAVMIALVIIILLLMAILGFLYAGFVHICLKKEFKDRELMSDIEEHFKNQ
jgi:acyl-coenzyme A synthetase/AMP-(fatty) acid ligase